SVARVRAHRRASRSRARWSVEPAGTRARVLERGRVASVESDAVRAEVSRGDPMVARAAGDALLAGSVRTGVGFDCYRAGTSRSDRGEGSGRGRTRGAAGEACREEEGDGAEEVREAGADSLQWTL